MNFAESFTIASGSVPGRSHVQAGRPNQDAFACRASERALVAVVCDGCGSGAHSEVGARIGANVVARRALEAIEREPSGAVSLEDLRAVVLGDLALVASAFGGPTGAIVGEHLLFTILAVAITPERAVIFGLGDGLFALNEEVVAIPPFEGNAPPYLAYGLQDEARGPRFVLHRELSTNDVAAVALGTDGAVELHERAGQRLPGGDARVPSLGELMREGRYASNRDALRRVLACASRDVTRPVWSERRIAREPGLLEDDTTLAIVRRREA